MDGVDRPVPLESKVRLLGCWEDGRGSARTAASLASSALASAGATGGGGGQGSKRPLAPQLAGGAKPHRRRVAFDVAVGEPGEGGRSSAAPPRATKQALTKICRAAAGWPWMLPRERLQASSAPPWAFGARSAAFWRGRGCTPKIQNEPYVLGTIYQLAVLYRMDGIASFPSSIFSAASVLTPSPLPSVTR
jgi:hypothetical protein